MKGYFFPPPTFYGLPTTGQTTIYRAGDDGHFQCGLPDGKTAALVQQFGAGPHAATRFVDNGDGTITDNVTGLMWIADPATDPGSPFDAVAIWNDAIDNCLALTFAEHADWRLPNWLELWSLADLDVNPKDIYDPPFVWPGAPNRCWSSSTDAANTGYAYVLGTEFGVLNPSNVQKSDSLNIMTMPVRGGIYNNNTP